MKSAFYFLIGWALGALFACWMIGEYDSPEEQKEAKT